MLSQITSFLRESGKLYILYMSAGVAAIPAGVLYALLAVKGYDHWWTAVPAIIFGLWTAKRAWKFVDRRFFAIDYSTTASAYTNLDALGEVQIEAQATVLHFYSPNGLLAAELGSGSAVTAMADIEPSNQSAIENHAYA
jgi:hypothetical protein